MSPAGALTHPHCPIGEQCITKKADLQFFGGGRLRADRPVEASCAIDRTTGEQLVAPGTAFDQGALDTQPALRANPRLGGEFFAKEKFL